MSSMKKFQNILVTLNKLDLANRGQRLGPTSTCHHRLVFVHLRETSTITISGSLQNAWNILRSDNVFVSVFLFVCFILKSFTSWSVTILNRLELPVVCLVSLSLSAVTVCTRLASISTSKSHPHTCTMYMTAPSLHTCCFTSAIPFPSIFTKSPDEIVVEAVDFVEAIVLTARRNTLVISPYCVISLVKIFIFIEWALFHSQSLCYVINK